MPWLEEQEVLQEAPQAAGPDSQARLRDRRHASDPVRAVRPFVLAPSPAHAVPPRRWGRTRAGRARAGSLLIFLPVRMPAHDARGRLPCTGIAPPRRPPMCRMHSATAFQPFLLD
eukprot:scaffold197_cov82-Phaeocystis_antarctica.AAC.1